MVSIEKVTFTSKGLKVAGELYLPGPSAPDRKKAAIVISHPMTGVKEQAPALYARHIADQGFIVLIFDATYQGESEGEPRGLEDPFQRAEDVRNAVTYLTLRKEVDPERIGAVGICASGGYVPFAAQTDVRIKAVAGVSSVDTGKMIRTGLVPGTVDDKVLYAILKSAADERTAIAKGEKTEPVDIIPKSVNDVTEDTPEMIREFVDYYRTPRGQHPRSTNQYPSWSNSLLGNFDAFAYNSMLAPRPLFIIAGDKATTFFHSEDAIRKAQEPKELYVIKGKTHADLYDDCSESAPKIVDFMAKYLSH